MIKTETNSVAVGDVLVAAMKQIKEMDCVAPGLSGDPGTIASRDGKLGHNRGLGVVRTPK